MAVFEVRFSMGRMDSGEQRAMDGLVNSDKMFAEMPTELLHELGVEEEDSSVFRTPSGDDERRSIGFARLTIDGKTGPMLVVFSPDDTVPVLGKHSLMGVALETDPRSQRLIPARLRMCEHPRLVSTSHSV